MTPVILERAMLFALVRAAELKAALFAAMGSATTARTVTPARAIAEHAELAYRTEKHMSRDA